MARGFAVGTGDGVVHARTAAEAAEVVRHRRSAASRSDDMPLLKFAEQYRELVRAHCGGDAKAARMSLPAELNTEVRSLMRARGEACHPISSERLARVLSGFAKHLGGTSASIVWNTAMQTDPSSVEAGEVVTDMSARSSGESDDVDTASEVQGC